MLTYFSLDFEFSPPSFAALLVGNDFQGPIWQSFIFPIIYLNRVRIVDVFVASLTGCTTLRDNIQSTELFVVLLKIVWPPLKESLLLLVDESIVVHPHCEGCLVEILAELRLIQILLISDVQILLVQDCDLDLHSLWHLNTQGLAPLVMSWLIDTV